MKTIGFPISHKENELRRAILPENIARLRHPEMVIIEEGYGSPLGYTDEDYLQAGAKIASHEEVLKCEVICDAKIGDGDYLPSLRNQTVFGWLHAVRNREIADALIEGKLTAYAWEDMFENGIHTFHRNNYIAGEAAVLHASMIHGILLHGARVAVIGRGNTGRGATDVLKAMGADVDVYGREDEATLRSRLGEYDVVVNAVLWDTRRTDHIINIEDLDRMKRRALIVDISCDKAGAIESSVPTTIAEPTYLCRGIRHYVVDHTPSLYHQTTSRTLAEDVERFVDMLIEGEENEVLKGAKIVERGEILDRRIIEFQGR